MQAACQAIGCTQVISRPCHFCAYHWHLLPSLLRGEGWQHWRNTAEESKELRDGSQDWLRRCILHLRNSAEQTEYFQEG